MKPNNAIHYILFFLYLCLGGTLAAQDDEFSLRPSGITDGDTYAVIIGISKYKHIDSLRYAHRDAELFASYLQSDAGGNVPTENIKLLTDEQATISNIYMAKQWLEDIAKEDDLVFFYFAGHGDVESSLYKLGFLLAHDTPKKNYFNNAVRIEDINIMANTLSVKKKAKVMLITDACHSGKLAGSDNRGRQLVGDQLSTVTSNEVRIASCAADQLSQEDEFWGGGRGAFSFHLINGLKGLADEPGEEDDIITLFELEDYLSKNVMKDVFKEMRMEQTPVIQGKKTTKMAIVDEEIVAAIKQSNEGQGGAIPSGLGGNRSVVKVLSAADTYFKAIQDWDIDSATVETLAAHPTWDIVAKVIELFPNPNNENEAVNAYLSSIEEDPGLTIDFNRRLAAAIHDQCQTAINAYLAADSTELNRRQYYNSQPSEFTQLANKLDFARTLISEKNYLHQMMTAKSHYYRGIAQRLEFTQTYQHLSMLEVAMKHQEAALALDDRASYVHNEIGILNRLQGDEASAEQSWIRATELTPEWALPFSNLANLYHSQEKYELGIEFANKAIELADTYFMAHIMLARNASSTADYLTAEEHLRKSILYNNSHYLGFEDLGYLYTNTLDYQVADDFFLEAEKRKIGLTIHKSFPIDRAMDGGITVGDVLGTGDKTVKCDLNARKISDDDATANCAYAMNKWLQREYVEAEKYFEKVIAIEPMHPTAYRYLAEIAYMDKQWDRADLLAGIATQNYLSVMALSDYVVSHPAKKTYKDCDVASMIMESHYALKDLLFIHGYVLQKLGRLTTAERVYLRIIEDDRAELLAYQHLFDMHERQEQYNRAEKIINLMSTQDPSIANKELLAFYQRMIDRGIDKVNYHYKAGLLSYYSIPNDLLTLESTAEERDGGVPLMLTPPPPDETVVRYRKMISGFDRILMWAPDVWSYSNKAYDHFTAIVDDAPAYMQADIFNKLGDLYHYRYKDAVSAESYYSRASAMYENNGDLRDQLIQFYTPKYLLNDAYAELRELHDRDQLNYTNTVMLTDFATKKGDYNLAAQSIAKAKACQPSRNVALEKTSILQLLLTDRLRDAAKKTQTCIKANDDPRNMHYTLARILSLQQKPKKALQQIELAIAEGFDSTFVLDYDPALDGTRDHKDYQRIRDLLPYIDPAKEN